MAALHVSARFCSWLQLQTLTILALLVLLAGGPCVVVGRTRRDMQQEGGAAVQYCVAKPDANTSQLQQALDWTCGGGNSMGSVDCSAIQSGGSCYEPDTLADHASYAFTLYFYHQNAASHACDFKGLATLTSTNPSSGTCVYPTSASTSSSSPDNGSSLPPPSPGSSSLPFYGSPAPSPNKAPDALPYLCQSVFVLLHLLYIVLHIH